VNSARLWTALSILIVGLLVITNIGGWLVDDDEGSDIYGMWRFAEGEVPYRDFPSPTAPLFLLVGRYFVEAIGRDLAVMRLLSAVALMVSAGSLAWSIGTVWGTRLVAPFWCLTLLTPGVYYLARVFRADSLMLTLVFLALSCVVTYQVHTQRWLLAAGAVLFGLAMLAKLVALMPLLGVITWLLWRVSTSRSRRDWFADLLLFSSVCGAVIAGGYGVAELLAPGAISLVLRSPGVYGSAFGQRILMGLAGWAQFSVENWLAVLGLAAAVSMLRKPAPGSELWLFQLVGSAPFFLLSSPSYPRYLAYTVPSLAMLLLLFMSNVGTRLRKPPSPLRPFLAASLTLILAWPGRDLLLRQETDTLGLADWVRAHTAADDVVFSDYAEINFHAERRSIRSGAVINANWATTGLLTAELLIDEMEATGAMLVLHHVGGGNPPPHHLVSLQDYQQFREYLADSYNHTTTWTRAGQVIEIWQRR